MEAVVNRQLLRHCRKEAALAGPELRYDWIRDFAEIALAITNSDLTEGNRDNGVGEQMPGNDHS